MRLVAERLYVDGEVTGPGAVEVEDGRIRSVTLHGRGVAGRVGPVDDEVVLAGGVLTPGLLDLQINGAFGVDFAEADPGGWRAVREGLVLGGVTAFAPTLITAPLDLLAAGVRRIDAAARAGGHGARIVGAHVEGPFLSPQHHGAHDPSLMCDPTPEALDTLLSGPAPAIVTLAPERPQALAAVARLRAAGCVVSLGHTSARAAQVHAAADAGAGMVTHLFNAQRGLGHREPGTAGAALTDGRLAVGLIADLQHVAGEIVGLTFRAAAGRVVLVTDAVAAMGRAYDGAPADGTLLGGAQVHLAPDGLPRRADGTIAGSVLTLDQAVRNVLACGVPEDRVLDAVTTAPADVLGRRDLGRLAPGALADLVWWDDRYEVREVWLGGVPAIAGATRFA